MLTVIDIETAIEKNKEAISSFGVETLELFGSYNENNQNLESDIDFLVQFKSGKKNFDNYMDLKFFLEDLFNKKIDLVIKGNLRPELKPFIKGRVIYAQSI